MSGFNGSQGGMAPMQNNGAVPQGWPPAQPQGLPAQQYSPFQGNGRPVSAGQGFGAAMPQPNTQAFRGSPGLLGMGMPNHLQSGAMTTAQFMQNQQAMQNPPGFGQGLPQGSGSQFAFEGSGA